MLNGDVRKGSDFEYYASKPEGRFEGACLKAKESDLLVFAKYFPIDSRECNMDDKLIGFIEFVSSSLYKRLLGDGRTPITILLTPPLLSKSKPAIGSVMLERFKTFRDLKWRSPNLSGDVGFERYVAASIYMGNIDWLNPGNYGIKDGSIAAIDFGLSFTLKFSNSTTLLAFLAHKLAGENPTGLDDVEIEVLRKLEFNLFRLITAIEGILSIPDTELLSQMSSDINNFTKNTSISFWGNLWKTLDIFTDQFDLELVHPSFNPVIDKPEKFKDLAGNFFEEQRTVFEELLGQLRIISKFVRPQSYFNLEWLRPYFQSQGTAITEPLAHAALNDILIQDDNGEELDALDYAKRHGLKVFGSADPVDGVMNFCRTTGLHASFKFNGSTHVPSAPVGPCVVLNKFERWALSSRTTRCTSEYAEPFAKMLITILKVKYKNSTNYQLGGFIDFLKEYRDKHSIDVYLLLFVGYLVHCSEKREEELNFERVFHYAVTFLRNGNPGEPSIDSLFSNARFITNLKEYCEAREFSKTSYKPNYDYAARLLQYVSFKSLAKLFRKDLAVHSAFQYNTHSCTSLLSTVATYIFDFYKSEELKNKPVIAFPEDFQQNIARVFNPDQCTIHIIHRF